MRLDATFAPEFPPAGRVGFLSQSGALGLAVIERAAALGLGVSTFVSVGNKADISGNDLLAYWEEDPDTDLVLLYLESFGNPRKFARITRRVGRTKPIVAVKSGRSAGRARGPPRRTPGALIAASDVTVDALFHQAGVIRTDTLAEMFDVATLLANQPVPRGRRVGIVTNAGGPGILCADACEAEGLEVPPLPEEARAALAAFLPPDASVANPVDMIASASAEDYRRSIEIVARAGVDVVVVIFIPPLVTQAEEVARAIREAADAIDGEIPVLSVFMSAAGVPEGLHGGRRRIPTFVFPRRSPGRWRTRCVTASGGRAPRGDTRRSRTSATMTPARSSPRHSRTAGQGGSRRTRWRRSCGATASRRRSSGRWRRRRRPVRWPQRWGGRWR